MESNKLYSIYTCLLDHYGTQGWWPLYSRRFTEGRDEGGYCKTTGTDRQPLPVKLLPYSHFEIAAGAILTQNTAWKNVEKALTKLESAGLMNGKAVIDAPLSALAAAVRPSGYYNMKAKKLKILAEFLIAGRFMEGKNIPEREDLLNLWGIGRETADSILLYAYGIPVFIVDTYTKRMFKRLEVLNGNEEYDEIANIFADSLEKDTPLFNEYHALIVRHGKDHCRKKPVCNGCILKKNNLCSYNNIVDKGEDNR